VVCGLFEDSRNGLWLGQLWNEPQVTRLDAGKPTTFKLPTGKSRVDARAIAEDAAGNIWIGTRGDGLFRLNADECIRFTKQDGLSSEFILSLYFDNEGTLWVGTREGLNRKGVGKFVSFTTEDGLLDNTICFITEDDRAHLWFGSGSGVFQASKMSFIDS
jgi:ligand-binding sensor domain-containing protein